MAQEGQMVADGRLALRAEIGAELGDVSLLLAEQHQDLQAGRIRDLLEQLGDATDLRRRTGSAPQPRTSNSWMRSTISPKREA